MYLGIDVGTSAVKMVLVSESGGVITQASAPLQVQSPHHLWSEQNPDDWWQAVLSTCAEIANERTADYKKIRAIGLSGQMHGAVCLDEHLEPVRPAILWNDGRSHGECVEMLAEYPEIGALAGVPPMPGFAAPKLRWMAKHEPEAHARIRHVVLPKDYVRLKLTGELVTDMTDAAGSLWLDEAARCWSDKLCDVSATDPAWLPEYIEGDAVSGLVTPEAAATLGLSASIPVAGGGGDAAAGAVGIGAVNEGDGFISLGTSGQFFVATEQYRPRPESMVHAFAHCVPGRWFQMGVMLNGASPLKWWAETIGQPITVLIAEVDAEHPIRAPLFLPYLSGERSPHNDPYIRGGFYGLDGTTARAGMTQAVLDAVAYSFCDARDTLTAAGTTVAKPAAIGGGAQSDHLLQTISDALGTPLKRYRDAETGPAYGAARLAMIAAGDGTVESVISPPEIDREFEPASEETERHAERLERYRALYQALKPIAASQI